MIRLDDWDLLVVASAILAAGGERSLEGAVAAARELLELLREAEPEAYAARCRARLAEAQLRRRGGS